MVCSLAVPVGRSALRATQLLRSTRTVTHRRLREKLQEGRWKGRPAAHCPLQGASGASVREWWGNLRQRYAVLCRRDAAVKDLPMELPDSRKGMLLHLVTKSGDDASCRRRGMMPCRRAQALTLIPPRGSTMLPCSVACPETRRGLPDCHPGRPHATRQ